MTYDQMADIHVKSFLEDYDWSQLLKENNSGFHIDEKELTYILKEAYLCGVDKIIYS